MEVTFKAVAVVSAFTASSVVRSLWLAGDMEAGGPLSRPAVSSRAASLDISVWYCIPFSISEGVVISWGDGLAVESVVLEAG